MIDLFVKPSKFSKKNKWSVNRINNGSDKLKKVTRKQHLLLILNDTCILCLKMFIWNTWLLCTYIIKRGLQIIKVCLIICIYIYIPIFFRYFFYVKYQIIQFLNILKGFTHNHNYIFKKYYTMFWTWIMSIFQKIK